MSVVVRAGATEANPAGTEWRDVRDLAASVVGLLSSSYYACPQIDRPANIQPGELVAVHVAPGGHRVWLVASSPALGRTLVFKRQGVAPASVYGSSWELVFAAPTLEKVALGDTRAVRWTAVDGFRIAGLEVTGQPLQWTRLPPWPTDAAGAPGTLSFRLVRRTAEIQGLPFALTPHFVLGSPGGWLHATSSTGGIYRQGPYPDDPWVVCTGPRYVQVSHIAPHQKGTTSRSVIFRLTLPLWVRAAATQPLTRYGAIYCFARQLKRLPAPTLGPSC